MNINKVSFSEIISCHRRIKGLVDMSKPGVMFGAEVYNSSTGKLVKKNLYFDKRKFLSKEQFENFG